MRWRCSVLFFKRAAGVRMIESIIVILTKVIRERYYFSLGDSTYFFATGYYYTRERLKASPRPTKFYKHKAHAAQLLTFHTFFHQNILRREGRLLPPPTPVGSKGGSGGCCNPPSGGNGG